ncbi:MAG: DUF5362 domain-containing protein [Bacteroidetes bacterium]|nr:DUF5362 domain-containing protein [Bacteroidota bacterium]MBU1116706.1 DUF5362 domain-containing protein [Bacteroidota bacterium]MBU1799822.1 DUF5362 domain-containing protein [Bacteroidota bacterium]
MEDFNDLKPTEFQNESKLFGDLGFRFNRMTSDMKFMGMFQIIYGVLVSLSIIGAIFGIPMLISGLRLREAADEFSTFRASNNVDSLRRGFELQGKFFNIQKIIILVGIALFLLYIVGIIFFFRSIFSEMNQF